MTEKMPKTSIKLWGLSIHRTIRNGLFTSLKSYKTQISKQILKTCSPKAIKGKWISLTHEQLLFLYWCMRGVHYDLINVLRHFSVIFYHEIFLKLNLPIFWVLMRHWEKRKNTLIFWLLTRIWIIKIYDLLLMQRIFKNGSIFWLTRYIWIC